MGLTQPVTLPVVDPVGNVVVVPHVQGEGRVLVVELHRDNTGELSIGQPFTGQLSIG